MFSAWPATMLLSWLSIALITILGFSALPSSHAYFGLTSQYKEPILSLVLDLEDNHTSGRDVVRMRGQAGLCKAFKLDREQRAMCRHGGGVASTLLEATTLAVRECQHQFRQERWNCSLSKRLHIIEKGFAETAFLHAITSAGLVHAFARACSQGQLEPCTCDETLNKDVRKNREAWMWGGCGDNLKYGVRFTRRLLGARHWNKDLKGKVDRHNSRVGFKMTQKGLDKICKCHGISGSCVVKTCWRQLATFERTGNSIKEKYYRAVEVHPSANEATGKTQLVKTRQNSKRKIPRKGDLVFIDKSPDYCTKSQFSDGTRGRFCEKETNCDVICCGRGYNVLTETVAKRCHCQVIWCCQVKCKTCRHTRQLHICK